MDTLQIERIMKRDSKIRSSFKGVFSLDEFKAFVKEYSLRDGVYVFNNETSEKSGEHWLLVYAGSNNVYFFDSFGKGPKHYQVYKELTGESKRFLTFSRRRLQCLMSDVCGEYCIFVAFFLVRNFSLHDVYKKFKRNCNYNDQLIVKYIFKLFNHVRL